MDRMQAWLAKFFALSLIFFSSAAIASPKIVVVVQRHPSSFIQEATVRLRAELLGAGFEVQSEESEAIDPNELFAQRQDVIAAIRITPSSEGGAIDLWITDAITHKLVARRVVEATPAALALRCVELLRASLLEIEMRPTEAPPEVKRLVTPKPPPPEHTRVMFEASAGMGILRAHPITGLQFATAIEAGVVWQDLRVGLRFVGPSTNAELTTPMGTVTMRHHVLVVDAGFSFDVHHLVRVGPALALGGYALFVRGVPKPGFAGSQSTSLAFVLGGGLDVAFIFSKAIEFFIDTRAFGAMPALVVVASDRAAMGAPLWIGDFGLRARL